MGDLVVGNIDTMSLAEIWNNDKMLHLRSNILDGKLDSQTCCRDCDQLYRYQTSIAGIPIGYLSAFLKDSPFVYALRRFF